ncbi:MAG TPA: hypothetical protein VFD57_01360 [Clostridia bacterium]|nr:hypothetical protein [Clostridia bacterium]
MTDGIFARNGNDLLMGMTNGVKYSRCNRVIRSDSTKNTGVS